MLGGKFYLACIEIFGVVALVSREGREDGLPACNATQFASALDAPIGCWSNGVISRRSNVKSQSDGECVRKWMEHVSGTSRIKWLTAWLISLSVCLSVCLVPPHLSPICTPDHLVSQASVLNCAIRASLLAVLAATVLWWGAYNNDTGRDDGGGVLAVFAPC